MDNWYIWKDDTTYGPYNSENVKDMYLKKNISDENYYWDDSTEKWISIIYHPVLQEIISSEKIKEKSSNIDVSAYESIEFSGIINSISSLITNKNNMCKNHEDIGAEFICSSCKENFCIGCVEYNNGIYICKECLAEGLKQKTINKIRTSGSQLYDIWLKYTYLWAILIIIIPAIILKIFYNVFDTNKGFPEYYPYIKQAAFVYQKAELLSKYDSAHKLSKMFYKISKDNSMKAFDIAGDKKMFPYLLYLLSEKRLKEYAQASDFIKKNEIGKSGLSIEERNRVLLLESEILSETGDKDMVIDKLKKIMPDINYKDVYNNYYYRGPIMAPSSKPAAKLLRGGKKYDKDISRIILSLLEFDQNVLNSMYIKYSAEIYSQIQSRTDKNISSSNTDLTETQYEYKRKNFNSVKENILELKFNLEKKLESVSGKFQKNNTVDMNKISKILESIINENKAEIIFKSNQKSRVSGNIDKYSCKYELKIDNRRDLMNIFNSIYSDKINYYFILDDIRINYNRYSKNKDFSTSLTISFPIIKNVPTRKYLDNISNILSVDLTDTENLAKNLQKAYDLYNNLKIYERSVEAGYKFIEKYNLDPYIFLKNIFLILNPNELNSFNARYSMMNISLLIKNEEKGKKLEKRLKVFAEKYNLSENSSVRKNKDNLIYWNLNYRIKRGYY